MNHVFIVRYDQEDIRKTLETYMPRMLKLINGEAQRYPISDNERQFIKYAIGEKPIPTNIYEKAWEHYMFQQDRYFRSPPRSATGICDRCCGDGGINNGCPKCDGKGWINGKSDGQTTVQSNTNER